MPRSNHDAIKPRQEALALQVCDAPQLLHFVAGPNQELLHRLQRIESERSGFVALHLWGAEGAGKSFLCQCFGPLATQDDRYVIHDDIDVLQPKDHQTQAKLLQAFNRLREADDGVWLSTSRLPPTQLDLMADLRSRLSWGLVYELKLLADEDKLAALEAWAQRRGLPLAEEVLPWLLRHQTRNLAQLTRLLIEFDRFGLQRKRSLNLPLLRQFLTEPAPPSSSEPLG